MGRVSTLGAIWAILADSAGLQPETLITVLESMQDFTLLWGENRLDFATVIRESAPKKGLLTAYPLPLVVRRKTKERGDE